ncbi:PilL N-terminal domain-containing protein [Serratia marcescens]|nr:PilL N-terminal domain-containing protein [Serratia marcescens]
MNKFTVVLPAIAITFLAGCTPKQKLQPAPASLVTPAVTVSSNVQPASPDAYGKVPEVVRYDRYLLVSTSPQEAQRAPLEQIIDIRIPASMTPSVGDAMRYALRESGFRLCGASQAQRVLYNQPLPGVQRQLGPMRLKTALQVMAGPAWQLEIDDVQRLVCHSLRDGYQLPVAPTAATPRFLTPAVTPGGKA